MTPDETDSRLEQWLRRNFETALADLHAAPESSRNTTINAIAFRLGQLVHETYLPLAEVYAALVRIVEQWPNVDDILPTMERALEAGMHNPVDLSPLRRSIDGAE